MNVEGFGMTLPASREMGDTTFSLSSTPGAQRILVVDDDPATLRLVSYTLEQAGFEVFIALSGDAALDLIGRYGLPHLAIVDLSMPGMDGFDLCRIVQQFSDLPVILLTAVDDEETIVTGIEQYAEDYITKPFSPRELLARVQRVLRRIGGFAYTLAPVMRIDEYLSVDFAHQRVSVGGRWEALTPLETKLLHILMRNAGHTVTTDFLLHRLWPHAEVFEESLRVHIRNLRKKVEADPSQPRYVVNERGMGYRFPAGH